MAGIGFHLKNMLEEESLSSKVRAYGFACLVTSGPWIIVTCTIFIIHMLSGFIHSTPLSEIELFTISVSYCFIFSQIVFGTHQLVVSRYVADLIFTDRKEHIFPAFLGVCKTITVLCLMLWFPFALISPLGLPYKSLLFFLFITVNFIWILSLFLTASKKFKQISYAYVFGGTFALLFIYSVDSSFFELIADRHSSAFLLLVGFTLGMFVTLFILFFTMIRTFPAANTGGQFNYLAYFGRYPSLFVIGLFYNAGLWISSMIIWFGEGAATVQQSFLYHLHYDTALFWSFLTIIPAIVLFVVALETSLYNKYRAFYHHVNKGGTLSRIRELKEMMFHTLTVEVEKLIKLQALFTLIVIILSGYLFNLAGIDHLILSIFRFTTFGAFFTVLFLIMMMLHLYFENRKGAMYCSMLFFILNGSFTLLLLPYGYTAYGISFAAGSSIAFVVTVVTLIRYLQNIEYHAFLGQGTKTFIEKKRMQQVLGWLNKKQTSPK